MPNNLHTPRMFYSSHVWTRKLSTAESRFPPMRPLGALQPIASFPVVGTCGEMVSDISLASIDDEEQPRIGGHKGIDDKRASGSTFYRPTLLCDSVVDLLSMGRIGASGPNRRIPGSTRIMTVVAGGRRSLHDICGSRLRPTMMHSKVQCLASLII